MTWPPSVREATDRSPEVASRQKTTGRPADEQEGPAFSPGPTDGAALLLRPRRRCPVLLGRRSVRAGRGTGRDKTGRQGPTNGDAQRICGSGLGALHPRGPPRNAARRIGAAHRPGRRRGGERPRTFTGAVRGAASGRAGRATYPRRASPIRRAVVRSVRDRAHSSTPLADEGRVGSCRALTGRGSFLPHNRAGGGPWPASSPRAPWSVIESKEHGYARGGDAMAYLMTHFWPGGTEEQYRTMISVVHPSDGLPKGQVYHAAGPTRRLSDYRDLGLQGKRRPLRPGYTYGEHAC